jgi:hypothetical protein
MNRIHANGAVSKGLFRRFGVRKGHRRVVVVGFDNGELEIGEGVSRFIDGKTNEAELTRLGRKKAGPSISWRISTNTWNNTHDARRYAHAENQETTINNIVTQS